MAEQEQNRTEPATPFKLNEAKKRGQVAKSMDLNSFLVLSAFLGVAYIWGQSILEQNLAISRVIFSQAGQVDFRVPQLIQWLSTLTLAVIETLTPLIVGIVITVILSNILQTGPILTGEPLKPDLKRLNPVEGFKRLVSLKMLFESVKTVIKLLLFGAILYFVLRDMLPRLMGLIDTDPKVYPVQLLHNAYHLTFALLAALALVAALDWMYSRWDHADKLKMSRREVKEEVKRREGDPQVRAKLREQQRELAKQAKSLRRVPDADVLITNPTHLAVALLYERGRMLAPELIAKGAGERAAKMKAIARRNHVTIIESKRLARRLFESTGVDAPIPEELYGPVAKILARVYGARTNARPAQVHP